MESLYLQRQPTMARRLATLALAFVATHATAQEAPVLKSEKEQLSYALGMDLGHQLHRLSVDVDPAIFAQGLGDALADHKTLMNPEDAKATIARLQDALRRTEADRARMQAKTGAPGASDSSQGDTKH